MANRSREEPGLSHIKWILPHEYVFAGRHTTPHLLSMRFRGNRWRSEQNKMSVLPWRVSAFQVRLDTNRFVGSTSKTRSSPLAQTDTTNRIFSTACMPSEKSCWRRFTPAPLPIASYWVASLKEVPWLFLPALRANIPWRV